MQTAQRVRAGRLLWQLGGTAVQAVELSQRVQARRAPPFAPVVPAIRGLAARGLTILWWGLQVLEDDLKRSTDTVAQQVHKVRDVEVSSSALSTTCWRMPR